MVMHSGKYSRLTEGYHDRYSVDKTDRDSMKNRNRYDMGPNQDRPRGNLGSSASNLKQSYNHRSNRDSRHDGRERDDRNDDRSARQHDNHDSSSRSANDRRYRGNDNSSTAVGGDGKRRDRHHHRHSRTSEDTRGSNGRHHDTETVAATAPSNSSAVPEKVPSRVIGDWAEYLSSQGKRYYFNSITEESQWTKPADWKAQEATEAAAPHGDRPAARSTQNLSSSAVDKTAASSSALSSSSGSRKRHRSHSSSVDFSPRSGSSSGPGPNRQPHGLASASGGSNSPYNNHSNRHPRSSNKLPRTLHHHPDREGRSDRRSDHRWNSSSHRDSRDNRDRGRGLRDVSSLSSSRGDHSSNHRTRHTSSRGRDSRDVSLDRVGENDHRPSSRGSDRLMDPGQPLDGGRGSASPYDGRRRVDSRGAAERGRGEGSQGVDTTSVPMDLDGDGSDRLSNSMQNTALEDDDMDISPGSTPPSRSSPSRTTAAVSHPSSNSPALFASASPTVKAKRQAALETLELINMMRSKGKQAESQLPESPRLSVPGPVDPSLSHPHHMSGGGGLSLLPMMGGSNKGGPSPGLPTASTYQQHTQSQHHSAAQQQRIRRDSASFHPSTMAHHHSFAQASTPSRPPPLLSIQTHHPSSAPSHLMPSPAGGQASFRHPLNTTPRHPSSSASHHSPAMGCGTAPGMTGHYHHHHHPGVGGRGPPGGPLPQQRTTLPSSLAKYYEETGVAHVSGWPSEPLERQARRVREDGHHMGSLVCARVSVELKKARSRVRLADIQSNLSMKRINFLQQRIRELENSDDYPSIKGLPPPVTGPAL